MELSNLIDRLQSQKVPRIGVLGDVILDKYLWGRVDRISPEAPVPVLVFEKETWILGGAANVAANLARLGSRVHIIGMTGDDSERDRLLGLFGEAGIETQALIVDPGRPTTAKTRVVGHSQQMLRVDRESSSPASDIMTRRILEHLDQTAPDLDAIIVSDYAKGVISTPVMDHLRKISAKTGLKVIVDPKNSDFSIYREFTIMSPNLGEAARGAGFDIVSEETLVRAGDMLRSRLGLDGVLITRGADGMSLFQKDKQVLHVPTRARNVYDVTGAGDTVVAVLALGLAHGSSLEASSHLANFAAGVSVGKVGTATVSLDEILNAIDHHED